jgi:D-threonate/D-erythronate kinase
MICLLIADDLTGACDAAAPFAARGLSTRVVLSPGAAIEDFCVLAVTTNSRDIDPSLVDATMAAIAANLSNSRWRVLFKKIDSTLRGNTAQEIMAAMHHFRCRAAVVCPAFPAMNRVVHNGYLKLSNSSQFAPVYLPSRLSCAHRAIDRLESAITRGERIISLDATCDSDLDRIARALLKMEDSAILWTGSAGLASALARAFVEQPVHAGQLPITAPSSRSALVLFCLGSDHPVTLAQERALASASRKDAALSRVNNGLGTKQSLRRQIEAAGPTALVLSGGDTALHVCRALDVQSIDLHGELLPGIPLGKLRGGAFDGTPVVTKSGGFGETDAFLRIADYFSCLNR